MLINFTTFPHVYTHTHANMHIHTHTHKHTSAVRCTHSHTQILYSFTCMYTYVPNLYIKDKGSKFCWKLNVEYEYNQSYYNNSNTCTTAEKRIQNVCVCVYEDQCHHDDYVGEDQNSNGNYVDEDKCPHDKEGWILFTFRSQRHNRLTP